MARPIKETPILFGEDARRFQQRMKENHKVSDEERNRLRENYEIFLEMLERGKDVKMETSY
ncbi:MAG: hypothetical protein MJZ73_05570 [Bacteroidaceae bacterium]|nr:hypothetical protein [Bacteroidaceae bacterium]